MNASPRTGPGPPPHPAALPPEDLLRDCDAERFRASGPGGQHRNKVETAVRLTHRPTGVTGQASERRSQAENHTTALFRLRVNLALSLRAPAISEPSVRWRSRVAAGRLAVNAGHEDFPPILAEALDQLEARRYDAPAAAAVLGVSGSQLLKLLRKEPRALAWLNAHRAQAGRPALR